jgi:hypothetical protein
MALLFWEQLDSALPLARSCPVTEHRRGGHGPETRSAVVLDVAQRLGIRRSGEIRFERGTARYRT